MIKRKIDWTSLVGKVFLTIVLFLLGTLASPTILMWRGLPVTPVNSLLTGIVSALLFGVFLLDLLGFVLKRGKVEDRTRFYFRRHTDHRRWLLIGSLTLIYVIIMAGLFLSIVKGFRLLLAVTIAQAVFVSVFFFLVLTLFPKLLVGVEGGNDINFLKSIARALTVNGEDVPDLEQLEEVGDIVFIPVGGSSLKMWPSRLRVFGRPEFYIFDRDTEPPNAPKYQAQIEKFNERPHTEAVSTGKREMENLSASGCHQGRPSRGGY